MPIQKISYAQSIKTPTGKQYESKLISISAECLIVNPVLIEKEYSELKSFVQTKLKKELEL